MGAYHSTGCLRNRGVSGDFHRPYENSEILTFHHSSQYTPSVSRSLDSSLREGAGNGTPQNANKKIPVPKEILGTRTEWIFCGTTLFAAGAATSCRRQHVRCLITPALRQKILSECCSPCPRRPICRLAYRPALSYAGLSVGATPALLPPHRFRI